jgi:sec-independent protein translocase protein TatA
MFGIGLPELIVILVIALIVFGPKRLPELGQTVGRWVSELRRATQDISSDLQESMKWNIQDQDILPPEKDKDKKENEEDKKHGTG